jgi:HSP20 family molecular chaperone IbpA
MTLTSWDLFDGLRAAQDEVARMARTPGHWASRFGQQAGTGPVLQAWPPAVDITERETGYLVEAELPGIGADDLEITFQDGMLTIRGERHPVGGTPGEKVHRAERRYGAFRRSISMPSHVQADKIEASAHDGVLQILVPKAAEAYAKRIPVQNGKDNRAITGEAGINGGWWPRSRDAGAELPGLIAGLSTQAGRVSRVALQADAFSSIPHQLTVGGHKVHVAWFRHMNVHTVSLTMAARDYLTLLVVPPQASPAAAAEALRLAASGRGAGSPEAILAAAGIAADGDPDRPQPVENVAR